jgi:phospholipid N-methyltransferase
MAKRAILASYIHFFWAGLAKQPQTGAFLPSQRFLVDTMISPVPRNYRGKIVELGTGNGILTKRLAGRCPEAQILACEINPVLAQDARNNLARAGINGRVQVFTSPAEELLAQIIRQGTEKPGFVISCLPLANFERTTVVELVQAARRALADGGLFIQMQHLMCDRHNVRAVFPRLRTVPVFLNLPPAFVYFGQK